MKALLVTALITAATTTSAVAIEWQHIGTQNYDGKVMETFVNADSIKAQDWEVMMDIAYVVDVRGKNFTAIFDYGVNCNTNNLQYSVPVSMTLGGEDMDMSLQDRNALSTGLAEEWMVQGLAQEVDAICGLMGK